LLAFACQDKGRQARNSRKANATTLPSAAGIAKRVCYADATPALRLSVVHDDIYKIYICMYVFTQPTTHTYSEYKIVYTYKGSLEDRGKYYLSEYIYFDPRTGWVET
jgi:hypothetical protein